MPVHGVKLQPVIIAEHKGWKKVETASLTDIDTDTAIPFCDSNGPPVPKSVFLLIAMSFGISCNASSSCKLYNIGYKVM